jgi:hypothetical protein
MQGCAPLNIPVSAHFKGFLEVVEADKPKKVIKEALGKKLHTSE